MGQMSRLVNLLYLMTVKLSSWIFHFLLFVNDDDVKLQRTHHSARFSQFNVNLRHNINSGVTNNRTKLNPISRVPTALQLNLFTSFSQPDSRISHTKYLLPDHQIPFQHKTLFLSKTEWS